MIYGLFSVFFSTSHAYIYRPFCLKHLKGMSITMKTLCICLMFLPVLMPGSEKNVWTLKKEKDGMTIYNRHSDVSKFNDIRVDMDLPGTVEQLAAILLDVDRYTDWVYATKSSTTMKKVSENEVIYYSEIGTPWPTTNRDFYA